MLTESEALQRILDAVTPLPSQMMPLTDALHRFAAASVVAMVPLPGFDNSSMDGYALRAIDSQSKEPLRVIGEQPAGVSRNLKLEPHCAIRIFTGAPLPKNVDAVIMQEDVTTQHDGGQIICNEPVAHHENVRLSGCDLCVGQRILDRGARITPTLLGVLASQGICETSVFSAPRTAIITTGDELIAPGAPLLSGQLYNSNAVMLQMLVKQIGVIEVTVSHLPDDLQRTTDELRSMIESHDFIILSGGVSVGDHDCIRPALESLGIAPEFWRVKMKPGKPLLFTKAKRNDGGVCHIFGLPGNPVSSFVTFQIFVRPALLKTMGAVGSSLQLPQSRAILATALTNKGDRPHYLRGHCEAGCFTPQGVQQSHALFALSQSNALLRMESEASLNAGAEVIVLLV